MSTHGDGGKGSARRQEDVKKIHDNWDLIFNKGKKAMIEEHDETEICPHCSGSGEGRWEGETCFNCNGYGEVPVDPDDYEENDYDND